MRGAAAAFLGALVAVRQVLSPRAWALCGALLAGLVAYVLVLSAPVVAQRAREAATSGTAAGANGWELGVIAGGMTLLGGAALVWVLAWLAREAERRPYASIAPVLAAFSACVLMGLRAPLPLPGIASEQLAVFALAAAVVGGSLVRERALSTQLGGLALALFPAFSVLSVIWAATGHADPARAFMALAPRALAFVGMLLLSSFAVALIATLGSDAEHAARAREGLGSAPAAGAAELAHERPVAPARSRRQPTWRGAFLGVVALVMATAVAAVMLRAGSAPSVAPLQQPGPPASSPSARAAHGPSVSAGTITLGGAAPEPVVEPVVEPASGTPDASVPGSVASVPVSPVGEGPAASEESASRSGRGAVARSVKSKSRSKGKVRPKRRHRRPRRAHAPRSRHEGPPSWGDLLGELPKAPAASRASRPPPDDTRRTRPSSAPNPPPDDGQDARSPPPNHGQGARPSGVRSPPVKDGQGARPSGVRSPPVKDGQGARPSGAARLPRDATQGARPSGVRSQPLGDTRGARKAPPEVDAGQDAGTVRDVAKQAPPSGDDSLEDLMQRALSP